MSIIKPTTIEKFSRLRKVDVPSYCQVDNTGENWHTLRLMLMDMSIFCIEYLIVIVSLIYAQ